MPSPQKLRDLKFKKYPFWRIDKTGLQVINGGWHFSFLQNPSDIAKKINSFSHGEFNNSEFTDEIKIEKRIDRPSKKVRLTFARPDKLRSKPMSCVRSIVCMSACVDARHTCR